MDKRSGRSSSNKGRRSVNKKNSVVSKANPRSGKKLDTKTTTSEATRKISTVSDETKKYNSTDSSKTAKVKVSNTGTSVSKKNEKSTKSGVKKKRRKKNNLAWRIIKKIIIVVIILGILAGLIAAGILAGIFLGFFGSDFKMTRDDLTISMSNSEVYDAEGNLICTLNGNEKRKIVSLEDMPEYLPQAYVAIEDERFYSHNGVDIKRTGAATVTYILHRGSSSFGGSTITQQLVKNITNDKEDSAMRKVKEMARAIQIEKEISKDNILELYLNIIFVGGNNINGVALGAEYYFAKDVSEVTVAEAAFLAGINHTPNSYNPYNGTEEQIAKRKEVGAERTKVVLGKMKELGYIDSAQYDEAIAEVDGGLPYAQGAMTSTVIYSDHTEAAIEEIVTQLMEEKDMTREMAETKVYGGGYKIYTTEVPSIQNQLEETMAKDKYIMAGRQKNADGTLINEQSQAAMVVIEPSTGKVVGNVGRLGEKTSNGVLDRSTETVRQIGSAMKPIAVVGPAIQEGLIYPASVYEDKQTTEFSGDGKAWPKNYYTNFRGKQTVREAIEISGNVIPVRILNELGVSTSIRYLDKMGLTGVKETVGLSLALGSKEFSCLQMAAAYATIANDGVYITPTFYNKVVDSEGEVVIEPKQEHVTVFGESEDYLLKSICMQPVVGSNGTATYVKIPGIDTAAKTGTTDSDNDRWLCGFTPYYAAACWYGYDIGEQIIYTKATPSNPSGGIWDEVMTAIHQGLPAKTFEKPDNIVTATVCHDSGLLPTENCTNLVTDIFIKDKVPTQKCGTVNMNKEYAICEDTGMIAIDGACPRVINKKFDSVDEIPTEVCTLHSIKPSESPSASASVTPSATPSETPGTSVTPSTTPSVSPSTSTSPSTSVTPSSSTTPSAPPDPVPSE